MAYGTQFFVVGVAYIKALSLDPEDGDWALMGRNWARPEDREARSRLYARLLNAQRETAGATSQVDS